MIEKGKQFPGAVLTLKDGTVCNIGDFSQKENVVLVLDPLGDAGLWDKRFSEGKKMWEWLRVRPLHAERSSIALDPGIYLIDRVGTLVDFLPLDPWTPSIIETAYVYHEARHC